MSEERRELDPLSQLLGAIDAKLGIVMRTQGEDREAAAKSRTDTRAELREIRETSAMTAAATTAINGRVTKLEETVGKLKEESHQRAGARSFASALGNSMKIVWGIIGGVLAVLASRWLGK